MSGPAPAEHHAEHNGPLTGQFSAGSLFADRFRLVREIGAGGMGVVYEARDEKLDRRVALKCAKPGHRNLLPPEVRAAREVSHFNVCKVHDIHLMPTPAGDMEFLSMEFIEGETLSGRIRRAWPLPAAEAKEIAQQICAGLAQAHSQGVIHGDLKSGNVLLAKTKGGGLRAVITDFGLAKFADPDGSNLMSGRGGTIDYMAPELLLGERATVASDVYALGVLFHVMLTGHTPKRIDSGKDVLQRPPVPKAAPGPEATTVTMGPHIDEADWQRQIEELPRPWNHVVKTCLDPKPDRRFTSAGQVAQALAPRRTFLKWSAAAATVVAAGLGYWQWTEPPAGPPVRLAVLPFSMDGNPAAGVSGVALDVADRLSGARRNFSIISPVDAQQNQVDTPEKARTILGATHVLQTRLTGSDGQLNAEVRLIDLESGKAIGTLNSVYQPGDTATLAKALIGTVSVGLNLKSRTPSESVSDAAYPDYIQGLNLLRQDPRRAGDAIPYLERAIALDPRSALPHAALALVEAQRFRNGDGPLWLERAADTVGKAAGINPDSVQVLLSAGDVDQLRGRYEPAIRAFSRAATLDPGNASAWRALTETYQLAGRDEDAIATYRKAVAAQPDGYLPYLYFGNFYFARSQYPQAEEMFRKMTVLAPALASGHMNLGLALIRQGRYQESEQSLLRALDLRPSARLLMNVGGLYYEQERYPEALHFFQESAKQGAPSAVIYRNLGDAYRHLSRPREASDAYRAAQVKSEEEITTNPRAAIAQARLALLSALLGDARRAEYELSRVLSTESGNTAMISDAVKTFEVLKLRDKSIELLQPAPRYLLEELNRQPDLRELQQDRRFQQLMQKR